MANMTITRKDSGTIDVLYLYDINGTNELIKDSARTGYGYLTETIINNKRQGSVKTRAMTINQYRELDDYLNSCLHASNSIYFDHIKSTITCVLTISYRKALTGNDREIEVTMNYREV